MRQRQEMAAKQAQSDLTITQQLVSRIFLLFLLTGEEPLPPPTHPKGKKFLSQKDIHLSGERGRSSWRRNLGKAGTRSLLINTLLKPNPKLRMICFLSKKILWTLQPRWCLLEAVCTHGARVLCKNGDNIMELYEILKTGGSIMELYVISKNGGNIMNHMTYYRII